MLVVLHVFPGSAALMRLEATDDHDVAFPRPWGSISGACLVKGSSRLLELIFVLLPAIAARAKTRRAAA